MKIMIQAFLFLQADANVTICTTIGKSKRRSLLECGLCSVLVSYPLLQDLFCSYSTVCKPRSPRTAEPPPAFSSSLLGGGLNELDHLLQELNATQFNITGVCVCVCVFGGGVGGCRWMKLSITLFLSSDEILAQFPFKNEEKDKIKEKTSTSSG